METMLLELILRNSLVGEEIFGDAFARIKIHMIFVLLSSFHFEFSIAISSSSFFSIYIFP